MAQKKFWWLSLLLAGLLAMGFLVGCDETDDDDDDDATGSPVPESYRGSWFSIAYQEDGSNEIYSAHEMIWVKISSTGTSATIYDYNFTVLAQGSVVWQDGTTDRIVLTDTNASAVYNIPVTNASGNFITFSLPFEEVGSEIYYQAYHMVKDGGRIVGVVNAYSTNLPIAGATVTLTNSVDANDVSTTTTNSFGLYEFSGVLGVYYTVAVSMEDYTSASQQQTGDEDDLRFVSFSLREGSSTGTVSGLINDASTMNTPAVPVTVFIDGTEQYVSSDGTYIINNVDPGTHTISATAEGYQVYTAGISVTEGINVHNINLVAGDAGSGTITGVVNDSQEAMALEGVRLESDDGTIAYTDAAGAYSMVVDAGVRTVSLSLDGYYNSSFDITVVDGESYVSNQVLTPLLGGGEGEIRFVLTWGSSPSDLDSYLDTPMIDGVEYTVYYINEGEEETAPYATLDNDETSGYGPETITIFDQQPGTYKYMVHNYSEYPALAGSQATVRIYNESGLINTLVVPATGDGYWWYVCDLDGSTGAITVVNTMGDRPEFIPSELPAKISE